MQTDAHIHTDKYSGDTVKIKVVGLILIEESQAHSENICSHAHLLAAYVKTIVVWHCCMTTTSEKVVVVGGGGGLCPPP